MLKKDSSLLDSLMFAFGLEKGSTSFYTKAAEKMDDGKSKELFLSMADIEKGHMANIRLLYCGMENEACPATLEEFIDSAEGAYVEGGKLLEHALKDLDVAFLDEADAIKIAIKHEVEAHSFYIKAAKSMLDSNARVLFNSLAEEEKKHLDYLSNLLKSASV